MKNRIDDQLSIKHHCAGIMIIKVKNWIQSTRAIFQISGVSKDDLFALFEEVHKQERSVFQPKVTVVSYVRRGSTFSSFLLFVVLPFVVCKFPNQKRVEFPLRKMQCA